MADRKPKAKFHYVPGRGVVPVEDKQPLRLRPKKAKTSKSKEAALLEKLSKQVAEKQASEKAFSPPEPARATMSDFDRRRLEEEERLLEAALIAEMRELADENFWFFLTEVLFPKTWREHYKEDFHKPIADTLQALTPGENLMLLLPREHRKSYIVTIAWTIWNIIRDPNIRIQFIGVTEATCKKFATAVRDAFLDKNNEFDKFHKVYPDFVISGRTKLLTAAAFTHPRRDQVLTDPTVFSTYLSNPGTGGRADIQVFDDAFDRMNLSSPEMARKTFRKMLDLFPILGATSKYRLRVVIGTRWAHYDPYGILLGDTKDLEDDEKEALPPFKAIVRHCKENPNRPCEVCPPHVMEQFPHGHPDWDNGLPILAPIVGNELLEARLREYQMDRDKGESMFWHQYMNVCMAPGDQKISREWLITIDWPDWPAPKRRVLAIDSASKDFQKEGSGDYMVALMGSFNEHGRLLLRHGLRSRVWTKDEFIRQIVAWCDAANWWPTHVAKEKVTEDAFLTDVKTAFRNCQRMPHIVPVTRFPDKSKLDLIVDTLQGPFERAEIVFGSIFPAFLKARAEVELVEIGQTAHDDIGDTLRLFFADEVRVVRPDNYIGTGGPAMSPPNLNLYRPGQKNQQPSLQPAVGGGMMDQMAQRTRIHKAFVDFGPTKVNWNPSASPVLIPTKLE